MVCILLWSSTVRVHDSQAYSKMNVTGERISHILELREILLSIQTAFSLVNALTMPCEGGRSPSAGRDHFQCLLLENFVFWQCSLLIGSASWLERNQSSYGVFHFGYAKSIFWMLCDDQKSLPTQYRKRWQTLGVWVLSHWFRQCRRVRQLST